MRSNNLFMFGVKRWVRPVRYSLMVGFVCLGLVACDSEVSVPQSDRALIKQADLLLEKGEWSESINVLKGALIQNPANTEARWMLGRLYLNMGKGVAAQKELERAKQLGLPRAAVSVLLCKAWLLVGEVDLVLEATSDFRGDSKSTQGALLVQRSYALMKLQRYAEAYEALQRSLEAIPDYVAAWVAMARLGVFVGDDTTSVWWAAQVAKQEHVSDDGLLMLTRMSLVQGRTEDAEKYIATLLNKVNAKSRMHDEVLKLASLSAVIRNDKQGLDDALKGLSGSVMDHPLVAKGLWAMQQRQYLSAQSYFETLVQSYSNVGKARLFLGAAHVLQNRWQQGSQYLELFINRYPGSSTARIFQAISLQGLGQRQAAVDQLVHVQLQDPSAFDAVLLMGRFMTETPQIENESETVSVGSQRWLENAWSRHNQGLVDLYMRVPAPDIPVFKSLLRLGKAHSLMGEEVVRELVADMYRGDLKRARQKLETLIIRAGGDKTLTPLLRTWSALLSLREGESALALGVFEQVMKDVPGYLPAGHYLALMYWMAGSEDNIRALYGAMGRHNPGEPGPWIQLASLELSIGDLDAATKAFSLAIDNQLWALSGEKEIALIAGYALREQSKGEERVVPADTVRIGDMLARMALATGRSKQGLDWLQRVSNGGVVSLSTRLLQVRLLIDQQRWSEAEKILASIAKANLNTLLAVKLKIQVAKALGREEELLPLFRQALKIHPDDLSIMSAMLTQMKEGVGDDEALDMAHRIQQKSPTSATGYVFEGDVLMTQGRARDAVYAYRSAMSFTPRREGLLKLHKALVESNQPLASIDVLQGWIGWNVSDWGVRELLAVELHKAGRTAESIPHWRKIIEHTPDSPEAILALAQWEIERDMDEAKRLLDEGLAQEQPMAELYLLRVEYLRKKGLQEQILPVLTQAHLMHPSHARLHWLWVKQLDVDEVSNKVASAVNKLLETHSDFEGRNEAVVLQQKYQTQSLGD